MKQKSALVVFLLVIGAALVATAQQGAQTAQMQSTGGRTTGISAPELDVTKPIHIQAERLEADNEDQVIRFEGNVVAVQDTAVLNCDILLIYYKNKPKKQLTKSEPDPNALPGGDAMSGGEIDRLIAMGRVQMVQGDRHATCDRIEYNQGEGTVTLTGNPTISQGKDGVRGSTIVVHQKTKQVEVLGGSQGRVNVTITPRSIQQAAEPPKKNNDDEPKTEPPKE